MSAIGKGDWVECVDARPDGWGVPVGLLVGGVYQVLAVQKGFDAEGEAGPGLVIKGHEMYTHPSGELRFQCFEPLRFRPIYRPKAEFIESLKAPAPAEPISVGEPA